MPDVIDPDARRSAEADYRDLVFRSRRPKSRKRAMDLFEILSEAEMGRLLRMAAYQQRT